MVEFYTQHRAQHASLPDGGDELIFRWKPRELEISRRLVRSGDPANAVRQLSLRFGIDVLLPRAGQVRYLDPTAALVVPPFYAGAARRTTLNYET